ncbi:MAG: hypothetical protein KAW45_05950, partial [Thermoplasmatales archaeon]|nr:hypothetical protein [Thermoplasmatales archaeon]
VGESVLYTAVSTDPENDLIQYGWVWNCDDWDWGTVDYWTEWYDSGETCIMSRTWNESGIYTTRVKARDIHGAEILPIFESPWSQHATIVCLVNETVDQWQTIVTQGARLQPDSPFAQSFKPNVSSLTKIKLKLFYENIGDDYPINLIIRENLDGADLAKASKLIETTQSNETDWKWIEFNLDNSINLISQSTYYIILETSYDGDGNFGWSENTKDAYPRGKQWVYGPSDWHSRDDWDFCFVTYQ